MNSPTQSASEKPFFPGQLPGTAVTTSYPSNQNDEDCLDFNSWIDFASTYPLEYPFLPTSESGNLSDSSNLPSSDMLIQAGNLKADRSLTDPLGSTNVEQQSMVQIANMVGSFLALNSRPYSQSLNLHPIPNDLFETLIPPSELRIGDNNSANVPTQVVKTSSSQTLLVKNMGGFEVILDLTVAATRKPISPARGRHGPLSEESRMAMKLLSHRGACWHCRFTNKKCDIKDPCDSCPKVKPTPWRIVGCRRGTLKDALPPVVLCPFTNSEVLSDTIHSEGAASDLQSTLAAAKTANDCLLEGNRQRKSELENMEFMGSLIEPESEHQAFVEIYQNIFTRFQLVGISDQSTSTRPKYEITEAVLLRDTVIAILWESQRSSSSLVLQKEHGLDAKALSDLGILLCSVALYQIEECNDQLIKQSLLCLQASLEAVRVQSSCTLTRATHQECNPSSCKINCFSELDINLGAYLDLLIKVLFKKNSKNRRDWWLSVFYSLCIQSYVRKLLITIGSHLDHGLNTEQTTAKPVMSEYLHLVVALFAACNDSGMLCSKNYDPLSYNLDELSPPQASAVKMHSLNLEQAKLAQIAVQQTLWDQKHIDGSYSYLRKQFEVDYGTYIPPISKKRRHGEMDYSSADLHQLMKEVGSRPQDQQENTIFQGPLETGQSSICGGLDHVSDNDLEDFHILSSFHDGTEVTPPVKCLDHLGDLRNTRENKSRFDGDLYTPRWIRDFESQGWCGLCNPGRWINMKDGWWNDRVLFHGICAETGKPFPEPEVEEEVDASAQTRKGFCGKCKTWVTFKTGDRRHYSGWHVHSANCFDENFIAVKDPVIDEPFFL
ncbi:hypothetical protein F5884DRAFT_778718 [Xylogone sp. PMI_703]|nr:hypothetical protein F5884DRAFT_778718 [Xylogone sp. PMI_703]